MFLRRAALALPLLLAGCASQNPKNSTSAPGDNSGAPEISRFDSPADDLGRAIALKAPARRVIVIGPGAIETVFALGAQKSLVGRDDYADFPPAAKKVAIAGDYKGPNVEQCVALQPDLVIVQGETWDRARVEQWQSQIGAPVAALVATDVAGVRRDFLKIGAWLGREKAAQSLAESLNASGRWSVRSRRTPKAFFEVGRSPLSTAGKGTLIDDVMNTADFQNIAADVKGYQPFGIESLISRAPDVYIATSNKPRQAVLRELRANASLSKLQCIQRGQIIVIKGDHVLRPGPRLALGIKALIEARDQENN